MRGYCRNSRHLCLECRTAEDIASMGDTAVIRRKKRSRNARSTLGKQEAPKGPKEKTQKIFSISRKLDEWPQLVKPEQRLITVRPNRNRARADDLQSKDGRPGARLHSTSEIVLYLSSRFLNVPTWKSLSSSRWYGLKLYCHAGEEEEFADVIAPLWPMRPYLHHWILGNIQSCFWHEQHPRRGNHFCSSPLR